MEPGSVHLDHKTWQAMYTQYRSMWLGIALGMNLSYDEAEDVLHGVLASLLHNPSRDFESMDHLRNYVSRAMINRSIQSSHRRERISPLREFDETREGGDLEQIEEAIRASMLQGMMEKLPPSDAALLQLRYFDGLTFVEMSKQMGKPISTLKSRVDAAIVRMRKIVGDSVV